jgi:hypothetical protein
MGLPHPSMPTPAAAASSGTLQLGPTQQRHTDAVPQLATSAMHTWCASADMKIGACLGMQQHITAATPGSPARSSAQHKHVQNANCIAANQPIRVYTKMTASCSAQPPSIWKQSSAVATCARFYSPPNSTAAYACVLAYAFCCSPAGAATGTCWSSCPTATRALCTALR